ncbi:hypothetical protein RUND412_003618 [Rhizina undulata]
MNRLFSHPPYAEDQPHPYLILTAHVLHRGFTVGSLFGAPIEALWHRRSSPTTAAPLVSAVLRGSAKGSVVGTALAAVALAARMQGKEEIEWKDRSWRILANESQNRTDALCFGGIVVGAVFGVALKPAGVSAISRVVGASALGSVGGMLVATAAGVALGKGKDGNA